MKRAVFILACLCGWAAAGSKAVVLDGKEVVIGAETPVQPLVEVRNLRVFTCRDKAEGITLSAISGQVVSHLPHPNFTVTLTIALLDKGGSHLGRTVTTQAIIKAPPVGQPVSFKALAPCWFLPGADGQPGSRQEARYITTFRVDEGVKPTAPEGDNPF